MLVFIFLWKNIAYYRCMCIECLSFDQRTSSVSQCGDMISR
uniref:Uncharacterized protein n=1 Tax=Arundo donax TaxID=35708 RepID=A0A0A9GTJ7_ARUDO